MVFNKIVQKNFSQIVSVDVNGIVMKNKECAISRIEI